ncbi:MAG: winged helix-turn-helix transcriptional regulator [Thomasclavelia ramosa]
MIKKENLPECPVATTVELIGSKWKLLILKYLLNKTMRYNELKREIDGISQKVLTSTLKSMVEDGIVIRTSYPEVHPEVPPRVEYSLSEIGESMRPVIDVMADWGNTYKNKK